MSETHRDFSNGWITRKDGRREPLSADEAQALMQQCEAERDDRAARMPDEKAALRVLTDAYNRLCELGWSDAIYCPKDGTSFDVIEAGSSGIHRCCYYGKWPDGHWMVEADGDLWPSRPILFRRSKAPSSGDAPAHKETDNHG